MHADISRGPAPIRVVLPLLPPTVNHMYIARRQGGKALSDEATTFRRVIRGALNRSGATCAPDGALALTMRLAFGNRRRQDLDNRLKAAIDALAHALSFDDRRIVRIVAERVDGAAAQCDLQLESYDAGIR